MFSFSGEQRYTGKDFDSDTGLYYFNARWYDPQTGRFITQDPILDGTLWYAYCNNNPMSRIDQTGLADGEINADADLTQEELEAAAAPKFGLWAATPSAKYTKMMEEKFPPKIAQKVPETSYAKAKQAEYNADNNQETSSGAPKGSQSTPQQKTAADSAKKPSPGRVGSDGEKAVKTVEDIGKREKYNVDGRDRVTDGTTSTTIHEVKNTASQGLTQQIKDGVKFAKDTGRNFVLWVRDNVPGVQPGTKLSKPLQKEVDSGKITIKKIPLLPKKAKEK